LEFLTGNADEFVGSQWQLARGQGDNVKSSGVEGGIRNMHGSEQTAFDRL
jgi:hypothetical protein